MQYARTLLALTLLATPALADPPRLLRADRSRPPAVLGPHVELGSPQTVPVGDRLHRYYPQQIAGAPVLGCGVDEIVAADGSSTIQSATVCATTPTVATTNAATAAASARAAIEQTHPAQRYVVGDAVAAFQAGGAPVWMVDIATSSPWNLWRVFVDGGSGDIRRIISVARDARGSVFPNPDAVKHDRPSMRKLRDLDPAARTLSGEDFVVDDINDYLALCDVNANAFCTPAGADTCAAVSKGGSFHYSPDAPVQIGSCTVNDRFDQVTAYYQLSEMAHFFRGLGWEPGSGALAGAFPLPVIVNMPYLANAYFVSAGPKWPAHITFGDEATGVDLKDFTNDPTVPRHEFTHAVVHDAAGGINDDDTCITNCSPYAGAMHEGFADYFAIQSLGGKQTVVGSQLGGFAAGAERDIDNELRFPCDLSGEVHDDGRMWSGFLRDVKSVVGRGFDAAVVRSIANIPHGLGYSLGFGEAFEAILGELPSLSEKTTIEIVQHATRRGVLGAFAKDRGASVTVDTGDAAWLCRDDATCGVFTNNTGELSAASITTPVDFTGGLAARFLFDPTAPIDLRSKQLLHVAMYANPAPGAGEVSLVFDDDLDCSSPLSVVPLPAFDDGQFSDRYVQFTGSDNLSAVLCVGLLLPAGGRQVLIDQIDTGTARFGPVVLPIHSADTLTLKNYFPLAQGDSHFYYFIPPPGASTVSIKAQATGKTENRADLRYCGAVSAGGGSGFFPAELSAMHLWTYDPSQPVLPSQLTLLPVDSHQLIAAIPAFGARKRAVRSLPLPPSPTGVYAVSIEGTAKYSIKLSFK